MRNFQYSHQLMRNVNCYNLRMFESSIAINISDKCHGIKFTMNLNIISFTEIELRYLLLTPFKELI